MSGAKVRVIAGNVGGTEGGVTGIAANPTYLDVRIPPGHILYPTHSVQGHTAFAYVFEGIGGFCARMKMVHNNA